MTEPRLPRMSDCQDCADPIRFVKLPTGKNVPVNPAPGDDGNVVAHLAGGRLVGYVLSKDRGASPMFPLRFVPHAATCPEKVRERAANAPDRALF